MTPFPGLKTRPSRRTARPPSPSRRRPETSPGSRARLSWNQGVYANKTLTTGEGGMLTTNDEALARRARLMRLHGIDREVWARFTSSPASWEYDVVAPGYKYNMPDINAAIGLAQLERAGQMRDRRQRCAEF